MTEPASSPAKPTRAKTSRAKPAGAKARPGLPAPRHRRPERRPGRSMDVARRIVELAEDKKAADIVLLDLDRPDDARRRLRHLLGRVGAAARRDRRRHRLGHAGREGPADRPRGRRRVALGPARLRRRSSSTSSRRPSATTTRSRSTGPRRRRSCGSSRRPADPPRPSPPADVAEAVRTRPPRTVGIVPSGHVGGGGPQR